MELDTAPLIYYIEEEPAYLPLVDPCFGAVAGGDLRAEVAGYRSDRVPLV